MQRHLRQTGARREDVSPAYAVLYGAAAGYALWATIYPFDGPSPSPSSAVPSWTTSPLTAPPPLPCSLPVIKSKLQTDHFPTAAGPKPQYASMADAFAKVWRTQGVKGFTNGLGPTLIRSPFANGATFVGFEIMMRALS